MSNRGLALVGVAVGAMGRVCQVVEKCQRAIIRR
jgi:hypothetical protein